MEKTIFVQTDENLISTAELEPFSNDLEGIILVYVETKLIGSVIYSSRLHCWLMETFYDRISYDSLDKLIEAYPSYKFIYLEE